MSKRLITRRQFSARCAAFGLSFPVLSATFAAQAAAQAAGTVAAPKPGARTVKLPDGTTVPPLGQGCWHLGQGRHPPAVEEEALRTGISLGMTLLDTSGNYGQGRSEQLLSHVIADHRDRIFLVSKVEGDEVAGDGIARACAASLARLGTEYLDLYLLHWPCPSANSPAWSGRSKNCERRGRFAPGASPISTSPRCRICFVFQTAIAAPRTRSLTASTTVASSATSCRGASAQPAGHGVLAARRRQAPRDRRPHPGAGGASHGCSAAAIALSWVIRSGSVIAIPESGSAAHVRENAVALSVALTSQDLHTLDAAFPGPAGAS